MMKKIIGRIQFETDCPWKTRYGSEIFINPLANIWVVAKDGRKFRISQEEQNDFIRRENLEKAPLHGMLVEFFTPKKARGKFAWAYDLSRVSPSED